VCAACHEEHHVQLVGQVMGQSWGLEANIMGVFADSNSLVVESVLYVEGVFREFKFDRQFRQGAL